MSNQELELEVKRLAEDHSDIHLLAYLAGDELPAGASSPADLFARYDLADESDRNLWYAFRCIALETETLGTKSWPDPESTRRRAEWQADRIRVTTGIGGPGTWFEIDQNGETESFASWSDVESGPSYAGRYPNLADHLFTVEP